MKQLDNIKKKSEHEGSDLSGTFPDQRWRTGGQGSSSSWVEDWLGIERPANKGIDRWGSRHLSIIAAKVRLGHF